MHPARIVELLQPFLGPADEESLTPSDLQHISMYIDILSRWNERINLTSVRSQEDIVTRHFGESFFAARHLFRNRSADSGGRFLQKAVPAQVAANAQSPATKNRIAVADLGSGAGFPGLPIKLWVPEIDLTLIESNHKKSTFLREVVRALTLTGVDIENSRAEMLTPAQFDLVTLRAVEGFAGTLGVAARLLASAGRLSLLIGSSQVPVARSALASFSWDVPIDVPMSHSRVLLVGSSPSG